VPAHHAALWADTLAEERRSLAVYEVEAGHSVLFLTLETPMGRLVRARTRTAWSGSSSSSPTRAS
jgi:hypothetical protein